MIRISAHISPTRDVGQKKVEMAAGSSFQPSSIYTSKYLNRPPLHDNNTYNYNESGIVERYIPAEVPSQVARHESLRKKSPWISWGVFPNPMGRPPGQNTYHGKSRGTCHLPWEFPWGLLGRIVERGDPQWGLLLDSMGLPQGLPVGDGKAHGVSYGTPFRKSYIEISKRHPTWEGPDTSRGKDPWDFPAGFPMGR